jgi:hypothetical protein
MEDRRLILRRDKSVLLTNNMDLEIESVNNGALFNQQAPVHIRITNAKRNANGKITSSADLSATAGMPEWYCGIIIIPPRTVD